MSQVGKDILAFCTRCKMDLSHIIVSMQGDRIAKVECKTCRSSRKFRGSKGVNDPLKSATRKKKSTQKDTIPVEEAWMKLMHESKGKPSKSYHFKNKYDQGDVISHQNYGDGVVEKVLYPNKIQVVFQNDVKTLIHAKS